MALWLRGRLRAVWEVMWPSVGDREADEEEVILPKWQMATVVFSQFFQGTQITLPFTLSAYMVRSFEGPDASEQLIGQLTGILAAAAPFSRFLCSLPWGLVSDVTGRKAVILLSNATSALGIIAYGASTSFLAAILARIIPSMLNGSAVAMKSMLGEACDATNQARGMAMFTLGWGFGNIVGPSLGGLLSEPCSRFSSFPQCGPGGIFQERPFLLPCLVTGALGFLAFLSNVVLMEETLPSLQGPGSLFAKYTKLALHPHEDPVSQREGVELPSKASDLASNGKDVVVDAAQLKLHLTASAPSEQRAAQAPTPAPVSDATRAPHPEDRASPGSPHAERHGRSSSPGAGARNGFENVPLQPGDDAEGRPAHMGHGNDSELAREPRASGTEDREDAQLLQGQESSAEGEGQSGDKPWYKDKSVLVAVLGASLVALSWNFLDELTPIFASAPPKQRGLGMPLEQFTYSVIFGGVVLVTYSLVIFPRYQKVVGPLQSCKVGLQWGAPCAVLVPVASLFAGNRILQQVDLFIAMGIKGVFKIMSMTSSMVLINLVAPKGRMGAVNGAAMALTSLARALGPALCGSIWALVVSLRFAGQQFVGFALMGIASVATSFLYGRMKLPGSS